MVGAREPTLFERRVANKPSLPLVLGSDPHNAPDGDRRELHRLALSAGIGSGGAVDSVEQYTDGTQVTALGEFNEPQRDLRGDRLPVTLGLHQPTNLNHD